MRFQRKALAIAVMVATSTLSACSSDTIDEIQDILDRVPTDIKLSNASVDENEKGAEIATLDTIDLDIEESFTYTTNDENFVISGKTLSLAADYALDYEKETSVTFDITVTDKNNNEFTKAVTIEVNDLLDTYSFNSKFVEGESSVSYGGQIARHALIAELKHYIGKGGLQADLDKGDTTPFDFTTKAGIIAKLNSFYDADENSWETLNISFMEAKQTSFNELSSSYKSVKSKVAGQDLGGQHKDWSTEFAGWGVKGSITPVGLIDLYFQEIADIAIDNLGGKRYIPGAEAIVANEIPVYVTDNGLDLNQLIQKFLLMSVAYSQATDDYLDEEKGLKADNAFQDKGTKAYTSLEHQFDEGFGYFGAARDYLAYNDNEISGKVDDEGTNGRVDWNGQHDTDGDDKIDLLSEKNWGNSVNAAKRDRGTASNTNPTDYSKQAMDAFLMGRQLINDNASLSEVLSVAQKEELITYRDAAVTAWEKSVAATVVHYINDLHADLTKASDDDFDFVTTAKHFSELKGFALGLQFNPYSPMTDAQFEAMHVLLKDAPVLVGATEVATYQSDLIKARDILQTALSFDAENVTGW